MNLREPFQKTTRARTIARVAALLLLSLPAGAADTWTNRSEYDLALSIRTEATPRKKIELLDKWKAAFPNSQMRQARRELYIQAYEALGDGPHILETAQEILSDQADNFVGLYWCAVALPGAAGASADLLKTGEKAGRQLLAGLDAYFAPEKKPATTPDENWRKQKMFSEALAHRELGWILWQRKDYAGAESELTASLRALPANAEVSSWLGTVQALQKQPEKLPAAIWSLARATALRGEGALPEGQRGPVNNALERMYTTYHGTAGGLDELLASAAASPMPPAGFHIESAAEASVRQQEEAIRQSNPDALPWFRIRRQLEAPDGEKYYAETLSKAPLPRLKGKIVRVTPENRPKEVALGILNFQAEEVVLHLDSAFPNTAPPGTEIEFEGTPESFTRAPFTLTLTVEREKITGWPEAAGRKR